VGGKKNSSDKTNGARATLECPSHSPMISPTLFGSSASIIGLEQSLPCTTALYFSIESHPVEKKRQGHLEALVPVPEISAPTDE